LRAGGRLRRGSRIESKQFFFEKKNQKTVPGFGVCHRRSTGLQRIEVFWFFLFKKEPLAFASLRFTKKY
jgi:hypothetical protein